MVTTFWQKATNDVLIVVSFVLAVLFAFAGVLSNNTYFNGLMIIFSGFSLGYSVNRYTEMFKNKTEIENLAEKTFDSVYSIANQMLLKSKRVGLTNDELTTLNQLTLIMVSLRKHHDFDEHIIWKELKDMEREPQKWELPNLTATPVYNVGAMEAYKGVMNTLSHEYRTNTSGSATP